MTGWAETAADVPDVPENNGSVDKKIKRDTFVFLAYVKMVSECRQTGNMEKILQRFCLDGNINEKHMIFNIFI